MSKKYIKVIFTVIIFGLYLNACGQSDSEVSQDEVVAATSKVEEQETVPLSVKSEPVAEEAKGMLDVASQNADETIATVQEQAQESMIDIKASAEEKVAEVVAAAADKPYQIVDGKISQNAVEGWKTYNGGGCGACHGKGAVGSVGPNIGERLTTKLSKEQFVKVVTEGKPGTLMRPNKLNKRVMENMDNLYAYLVARGDGVLGPGNLLKLPFGKDE
jgi:mono/diheme cytochrome c family protein